MSDLDLGQLLKDITGLSVESIGADTARRVAERRMRETGIGRLTDYLALVRRSETERQALIDEVTIPETWFFRDHEPFLYILQFIRSLRGNGGEPVRILSVPCATGEEPYSIAMMLLDAGFNKDSIQIEAVDISQRAVGKAVEGVYGSNSFRGRDLFFRKKHFTRRESDGRYVIADEVKEMVHFKTCNVLAPDCMHDRPPFDVVLCRNLLIYFDLETKKKVLFTLHERMKSKSLLVLGHAETGRMVDGLFVSERQAGTFAYRKAELCSLQDKPLSPPDFSKHSQRKLLNKSSLKSPQPAVPAPEIKTAASVQSRPVMPAEAPRQDELQRIQSLADQGRLTMAMAACSAYITTTPDSAQAYYLKAVIALAMNDNDEAMAAFKKALYLHPGHYQALIHLSVLMGEMGDARQAETYRLRAERLKAQGLVAYD